MLKKVFASFSCALLIFSASVLPCFANGDVTGEDFTVNTDDTLCTVELWLNIIGSVGDFSIPVNTLQIFDTGYDTNGASLPILPILQNLSSFVLTEDVTVYWRIAPFLANSDGVSNLNTGNYTNIMANDPVFRYGSGYNGPNGSSNPTSVSVVTPLTYGDASYGHNFSRSYRAVLPKETATGKIVENFQIEYPADSDAHWSTRSSNGESLMFTVDLFQVVGTTDERILTVLDNILVECEEMNVNINNVLSACNNILASCRNIEADTETIISLLNVVGNKLSSIDDKLANVDTNVEAIYYLFSEALSSESEAVKETANNVILEIQENASAETYYQTSMKNTYDQLNLGGWGFGAVQSSITFVLTVFDDIWDAFGYWTVVFTFPLTMGIAMLVIGRISRFGGGNSSRTKEHKGGEGGA